MLVARRVERVLAFASPNVFAGRSTILGTLTRKAAAAWSIKEVFMSVIWLPHNLRFAKLCGEYPVRDHVQAGVGLFHGPPRSAHGGTRKRVAQPCAHEYPGSATGPSVHKDASAAAMTGSAAAIAAMAQSQAINVPPPQERLLRGRMESRLPPSVQTEWHRFRRRNTGLGRPVKDQQAPMGPQRSSDTNAQRIRRIAIALKQRQPLFRAAELRARSAPSAPTLFG